MLLKFIDHEAAPAFLTWLQSAGNTQSSTSVLHIRFSEAGPQPNEQSLLAALMPVWNDPKAAIYVFKDHEAIIVWGGTQSLIAEQVVNSLYLYFKLDKTQTHHRYYDLQAHTELLRQLAQQKCAAASVEKEITPLPIGEPIKLLPMPTEQQLAKFHRGAASRTQRRQPHILIIEDQLFSRKLLLGLLEGHYPCAVAADAFAAFEIHLEQAPDILLLDIELPDVSGHALAAAIRKFDDTVAIVMVTANHYSEDVAHARENKAKGFIVKPYSKQKILDGIAAAYSPRKW